MPQSHPRVPLPATIELPGAERTTQVNHSSTTAEPPSGIVIGAV